MCTTCHGARGAHVQQTAQVHRLWHYHASMNDEQDILSRGYLGEILPAANYYSLTLGVDEDGQQFQTTQTYFTGWANGKPGLEIRAPRKMIPDAMINMWKRLGECPIVMINTGEQFFYYYFYLGGNALIETTVAEALMPDFFQPAAVVQSGIGAGFTSSEDVLKAASRRFPTPRSRMEVFRRDSYRCRMCGRGAVFITFVNMPRVAQPSLGT